MILIYVPVGSEEDASAMARILIEEKLAACANLIPIRSVYRWEGETVEEGETLMILKTRRQLYDRCRQRIQALHSYQVPCIASLRVDKVNEPYLAWLQEQTGMSKGHVLPREKRRAADQAPSGGS